MAEQAAIITGASSGIGRALALGLAGAGRPVGLLARRADLLGDLAREINDSGGRAAWVAADVRDAGAVADAVVVIENEIGPTDLLVNNAGAIDSEVPLWEADVEEWHRVVETNLHGSFHVSRAVVAGMIARGNGRVVEIVSGAGARDWDVASAYTASKAALLRQVGHLHEAGFERGLRSFAIAPGTVETAMSTSMRLHAGRTEFTPVEATIDLVAAIGDGALDDWSGRYLRVTHDSAQSLLAHGTPTPTARRFGVFPWGPDDPALTEGLVPPHR